MKPTPELDMRDLRMALQCLNVWAAEDLAPHVKELLDCQDELAGHVQRAQRGKAA